MFGAIDRSELTTVQTKEFGPFVIPRHSTKQSAMSGKTQRTWRPSDVVIKVPLTNPIREVVTKIGNPDKRPGSYVFPIIPNRSASNVLRRTDLDKPFEERIDEIVRQKIKMVLTAKMVV